MASGERFDAITRLFGANMSRRQAMKLAAGSVVGTAGLIALQQGVASAQCTAGTCTNPLLAQCCETSTGPVCFPTGNICCGNTACPGPVGGVAQSQCCPGGAGAGTTWAPFCAPPPPVFCCGPIACTPATFCAGPGCCVSILFPAGTTCCGPNFCPPNSTCLEYPPGTFTCTGTGACPGTPCPTGFTCVNGACVPGVPSDRNIKENVVPVAW